MLVDSELSGANGSTASTVSPPSSSSPRCQSSIKSAACVSACLSTAFVSVQVLYEDPSANRMDEALQLFSEMTKADHFKETPFMLFLNKRV